MTEQRHIVSRHWTRENARKRERVLQGHMNVADGEGVPASNRMRSAKYLQDAGVPSKANSVRVERAGRIRARWVVVAVG